MQTPEQRRKIILSVFQERITAWQKIYPVQYQKIKKHLIIWIKHNLITQFRQSFDILSASLEQLEMILNFDRLYKREIYSKRAAENIVEYLNIFSLAELEQLFSYSTPDALIHVLKIKRKEKLEQLLNWESFIDQRVKKLQKSWKIFLIGIGKKAMQLLYHNSLIGLSAELMEWFAKKLGFCQNNLLKAFQFLGISGGIIGSCFLGVYVFMRGVVVGAFSQFLYQFFSKVKLDDKRALVIFSFPSFLSPGGFMRAINLFMATIESFYSRDIQFLLQSASGVVGDFGTTQLMKRLFVQLRGQQQGKLELFTENQAITLFFISLGGYQLGRLALLFNQYIFNKIYLRNMVRDGFLNQAARYCDRASVTYAEVWSPNFWANREIPMHLTCVTKGRNILEAICHIIPLSDSKAIIPCEIQFKSKPDALSMSPTK